MTGNEIVALAKKRLRNDSDGIDWNTHFANVIDEIFTFKTFKFSHNELAYVHSQQTFEKRFDADATELSLNKIITIYYTISYALVGGIPVPTGNSGKALTYVPYGEFLRMEPDHIRQGYPEVWTIVFENDGKSGIQIGIFPLPLADAAVWIYGEFIPSYAIDGNQLAILPRQFHRLVVDGLIYYGGEEAGQDKLSGTARRRFERGLDNLDFWDSRNPGYIPIFQRRPLGQSGRAIITMPDSFASGRPR